MIKIEHLSVVHPDGTKAILDLTCQIGRGESVALVGANGAGKTSLLLSLVGILKAAEGTIEVDGSLLGRPTLNDIRRRVGFVFQNPDDQLFMPELGEDIAFGPRNFGWPEEAVKVRVDEVLKLLRIEHLRHRSPLRLSGGEKRTAAIATALAMDPSLLLFDEPSAFLDPKSRRNLISLLGSLPQTKLIATHDLTLAAEVCDRVILLKNGTLFADGDPEKLLFDQQLMDDCDIEAIITRPAVRCS